FKEVDKVSKVNIGDKIRVVNPVMASGVYEEGDIFEVESVEEDEDVKVVEHGRLLLREEFEVLPKYNTERRPAKVGERILITNSMESAYDNGDVFTVTSEDVICVGDVEVMEHSIDFVDINEYEVIIEEDGEDMTKENGCETIKMTMPDGTVIEGTAESLAEMQKLTAEQAGEEGEVEDEKEEDETANQFNIGDKVRICIPEHEEAEHSRAGVTNEEIGTVEDMVGESIEVDFVSFSDIYAGRGHHSELEVVREADEIDLSLIRAGREPGEVKEGGVVEVTGATSGHPVGTIGEVVSFAPDGTARVEAIYDDDELIDFLETNLKLIAPANKRVDIDA